jgi:hypothetical protein
MLDKNAIKDKIKNKNQNPLTPPFPLGERAKPKVKDARQGMPFIFTLLKDKSLHV